jgi:hypothetical protein
VEKPVTNVMPLRKGGEGLKGTIFNAKHHAQAILPMIDALKDKAKDWGFVSWKQGKNVHEFTAHDGRRFTLRAYTRDGKYVGIRLSARLSRSNEFHLMDMESDSSIVLLDRVMVRLARGVRGNLTPLLKAA